MVSPCVACCEANLDQRKETNTLSDLITKRLKHTFLFREIRRSQWVVQLPVHEFCSWELRTFASGAAAQRDHKVEAAVRKVLHCLRCSSLQVNTDIFHHLDGEWMSISALDSSTGYLKML